MARACINSILGCQGEIPDGSKKDECHNCIGHWYRWRKRPLGERRERDQRLLLYHQRMIPLLPESEKTKIVPFRKRA